MFDLTDKNALVTGASGGIGGAIARALHAAGAHVGLSGTRAGALDALARRGAWRWCGAPVWGGACLVPDAVGALL